MIQTRFIIPLAIGFVIASTAWGDPLGDTEDQTEESVVMAELDTLMPREAKLLRVDSSGFARLSREDRLLAYQLGRAGIAGRDMWFELNHRFAPAIRDVIEFAVVALLEEGFDPAEPKRQMIKEYAALFLINGCQYNIRNRQKLVLSLGETPNQSLQLFASTIEEALGGPLPKSIERALEDPEIAAALFDPETEPVMLSQDDSIDYIAASNNNIYAPGVTLDDVTFIEDGIRRPNGANDHFLNSRIRLSKDGGVVQEIFSILGEPTVLEIDSAPGLPDGYVREYGHFSDELRRVRSWLEKAWLTTDSEKQRERIGHYIAYLTTGDNAYYDSANIAWVLDYDSTIDFVLGWVESYDDPLSHKGSWENTVAFVDPELNRQLDGLLDERAYFEANFPWDEAYQMNVDEIPPPKVDFHFLIQQQNRLQAKGLSGKNLPNKQTIREEHGSKNMLMMNNREASRRGQPDAFLDEFIQPDLLDLYRDWGEQISLLGTVFHEVVGHGAGTGIDRARLGRHYSKLEENRAQLCAIHYAADPKLVDIGLLDFGEMDPRSEEGQALLGRLQLLQLHRSVWLRIIGLRSTDGSQLSDPYLNGAILTMNWLRYGPEPLYDWFETSGGSEDQLLAANIAWLRTFLNDDPAASSGFGASLKEIEPGKRFLVFADQDRAAFGASALLALIQNGRGSGDGALFTALHRIYAGSADVLDELLGPEQSESGQRIGGLRGEMKTRADELGLFRRSYFLNPTMREVVLEDGSSDVVLEEVDDLDGFLRQQLELTRIAREVN